MMDKQEGKWQKEMPTKDGWCLLWMDDNSLYLDRIKNGITVDWYSAYVKWYMPIPKPPKEQGE